MTSSASSSRAASAGKDDRLPRVAAAAQSSQQRSRSLSVRPPGASRQEAVYTMIDEELTQLRPQLLEQGRRKNQFAEELQVARHAEWECKRNLELAKMSQAERRAQLKLRFRTAVKSWILRRRAILAMNEDLAAEMAVGPLLPAQLRAQLEALQLNVHALKYQEEDRLRGSIQIQSWWRGILTRRSIVCLRISHYMWKLHALMTRASTKIQNGYKAITARRKWRGKIKMRIRMKVQREAEFQEQKLRVTIQLQRAIRARIARKLVLEEKERMSRKAVVVGQEEPEPDSKQGSKMFDSWKRREEGVVQVAEDRQPPHDHELDKIQDAGLIPFYWNFASDTIRHRVGGNTALKIQRQLRVGIGANLAMPDLEDLLDDHLESDAGSSSATDADDGSQTSRKTNQTRPTQYTTQDDVHHEDSGLGGNWNVYPEGLSQSFLKSLDVIDQKDSKKDDQVQKTRRHRRLSSRLPPPPPRNTKNRAQDREEAERAAEENRQRSMAAKAIAPLQHPLLDGMLPPNVPLHALQGYLHPAPPADPPSRHRPRPHLATRGVGRPWSRDRGSSPECAEEDPWAKFTSFYGEESGRKARSPSASNRLGGEELFALEW